MKKTAILLAFLFICSAAVQAQLIDPRKVAKRKAEQRTNQKVDQTVDKALDKIFGNIGKKSKNDKTVGNESDSSTNGEMTQERANGILSAINIGGGDPPKKSYDFNSSYVMQMKSTGNKKDDNFTMKMKYMFNDEGKVMGAKMLSADQPEMDKSLKMMDAMIFDWEQSQMYSLMNMDGQKKYVGIKIDANAMGDYAEKQNEKTTFVKTGKTKTIIGYVCDGYLSNDGENEYLVWMSRQAIPSIARYYDAVNRTSSIQKGKNKMAYDVNPEMLKLVKEGRAMMGIEMMEKGKKMEMEIVEMLPKDNITINTEGYTSMMNMGGK